MYQRWPGTRLQLLLPLLLAVSPFEQEALTAPEQAPQAYRILPAESYFVLKTGRSGLLGFLGHEHGVLATDWTANLCIDPERLANSSVAITVPVDSLRIDSPQARRLAGLEPDGGPDAETTAEIQAKMLGPEMLDAAQYPTITFRSDSIRVAGVDTDAIVAGRMTLHGRTAAIQLPVQVEPLGGDTLRMTAETVIRHSTFGMERESVAGVVNVADEMELTVRLTAVPLGRRCAAGD